MKSIPQSRHTLVDADVSWHPLGRCKVEDDAVFFHPHGARDTPKREREEAAKAICATCPLAQRCRDQARANREPYGVWGGESEEERAAWLREQRPSRRQKAAAS